MTNEIIEFGKFDNSSFENDCTFYIFTKWLLFITKGEGRCRAGKRGMARDEEREAKDEAWEEQSKAELSEATAKRELERSWVHNS